VVIVKWERINITNIRKDKKRFVFKNFDKVGHDVFKTALQQQRRRWQTTMYEICARDNLCWISWVIHNWNKTFFLLLKKFHEIEHVLKTDVRVFFVALVREFFAFINFALSQSNFLFNGLNKATPPQPEVFWPPSNCRIDLGDHKQVGGAHFPEQPHDLGRRKILEVKLEGFKAKNVCSSVTNIKYVGKC